MCHMAADSIDELHAMADAIGVARRHYQGPPVTKWPHYDICKAKRAAAVRLGAEEVRPREVLAAAKKCLGDMAVDQPYGHGEVVEG